jgi:cell division protein FtsA
MSRKSGSFFTAIDVGTTKIATLVATISTAGAMEIVAVGHATSEGMRKGLVVGPEELSDSVRRSVGEATNMLGRRLPPAFIGVTGSHLTCQNATGSVERKGKNNSPITQKDVNRLISDVMPSMPAGSTVVHAIPRGFQVDSLGGIHDPVGLNGNRIATEAHIVVGDPGKVENVVRVVRNAGAKVQGVILEHVASAEAVLTADERAIGVVLVDIGGGTSDIAIYQGNTVWYTSALPVAGHQFTSDVAIGLGIPPGVAEEAKLRYGSTTVEGVDRNQSINVATGEDDRTIFQINLNSLLRDRALELVKLVLLKVREAGLDRVPPGGIVFTGGAARLRGLDEIARDYGSCAVRIGSPSTSPGIPKELQETPFSTAVGLLLWGVRQKQVGAVSNEFTISMPVMQRLGGWITSKLNWKQVVGVEI